MLGPGYIFRAEPERVSLYCAECAGSPMIDILLGTQTDRTEERIRSGVTTMAHVERLCRAHNDGCRIAALDVAPAVGWVSRYPRPSGERATAVIIRDGQLLILRFFASGNAIANARQRATSVAWSTKQTVAKPPTSGHSKVSVWRPNPDDGNKTPHPHKPIAFLGIRAPFPPVTQKTQQKTLTPETLY